MQERIAIVQDTEGRWFVRGVAYSVESSALMTYHCDRHISGPHATLEEVPEVQRILWEHVTT